MCWSGSFPDFLMWNNMQWIKQPREAWMLAEILVYPVFQHLNYYGELNTLKNKHLAWRAIYKTLWPSQNTATSVCSSSVIGSISPLWESSQISSFLSLNTMNLNKTTQLRYEILNLKLHFSCLLQFRRIWTSTQETNDHSVVFSLNKQHNFCVLQNQEAGF